MQIIPVTADHDQVLSIVAAGRRITLRLRYNVKIDRWSLDLSRDDGVIFHGVRLLNGVDAFAGHNLGLGALLFHSDDQSIEPNFDNVVSGLVELVHVEPDEMTT